jgi:PilZ domain
MRPHTELAFVLAPSPEDRRREPRRPLYRVARIQFGAGAQPRECVVMDISDGGVRLHVDDFDVPDEFVLHLSGQFITQERKYEVVWRHNQEIGAKFISMVWQGMD